jgi:periplasmic protein TonB
VVIPTRRLGRALGLSAAVHAGLAVSLVSVWSLRPLPADTRAPLLKVDIAYFSPPGPAGGGGGHWSPTTRETEISRRESEAPAQVTTAAVVLEPLPSLAVDTEIEFRTAMLLQGTGLSLAAFSPTGGRQPGGGAGPGLGDGAGSGSDGDAGGGPRQAGGDVLPPTLLRSVDPKFTAEALAAKITGTVDLEVVVRADGTVGQIRVLKTLDRGLDQEAIQAARQWIFSSGTHHGRPVAVVVRILLDFRLREPGIPSAGLRTAASRWPAADDRWEQVDSR